MAVYPDVLLHLVPIEMNTISSPQIQEEIECSKGILLSIPKESVSKLPFPKLPPFFAGLCKRFCGTQGNAAAGAAEQLVDGKDLDEEWCKEAFSESPSTELEFALSLVKGKVARASDCTLPIVTSPVWDEAEARRVRRIPGRDAFHGQK